MLFSLEITESFTDFVNKDLFFFFFKVTESSLVTLILESGVEEGDRVSGAVFSALERGGIGT